MYSWDSQLQSVGYLLENMKVEYDNILIQRNIFHSNITSKIVYLGIKLIKTGITALNLGLKSEKDYDNYIKSQIDEFIYQMNDIRNMNSINRAREFLNYMNNVSNNNSQITPKINVAFKISKDDINNFVFDYGTTIDELVKRYLISTNSLQNKDNLNFRYEYNTLLKIGDNRKIEDVFKNQIPNVEILVDEIKLNQKDPFVFI